MAQGPLFSFHPEAVTAISFFLPILLSPTPLTSEAQNIYTWSV